MMEGRRTAREAERLLRKAVRRVNKAWTVRQITNIRGRSRGKGAHVMWGVYGAEGAELARGSLTTHPGDMSWTVTRGFEADFEDLLGKGWMDR
jgi:hypothetical protein